MLFEMVKILITIALIGIAVIIQETYGTKITIYYLAGVAFLSLFSTMVFKLFFARY